MEAARKAHEGRRFPTFALDHAFDLSRTFKTYTWFHTVKTLNENRIFKRTNA